MWCSALTVVFVGPLLFSFMRHPRPLLLLFIVLLGATAFLAIQLLHRSGETACIHAYLILLYLLLSSRMIPAGPNATARHQLFYYSFALVVIGLLSLSGRYTWLLKIPVATAALFSLVVSLVFFTHAMTNASPLGEELLNTIYQTDPYEAIGYIETFIGFIALPLMLIFLVLPTFLLARLIRRPVETLPRGRTTALLAITLLLTWETARASNEYLVMSTASQYHRAMERYRTVAAQRRAGAANRHATIQAVVTRQAAETHVIVIGESTSRNHMGLYGYFRDTTPNLSRLATRLVILTDAISSDCFTQPVLAQAFTTADVDERPDGRVPAVHSLVDILRAAGLRVYWLSNQSRIGFWDTHTSLLSEGADRRVFLSTSLRRDKFTSRPDEDLVPLVRRALDETRDTTVMFVHLMGTHIPYHRRYPQHFARYREPVPSEELGGSPIDPRVMARINEYDNAVLYNDYVVSTLIEDLRRRGGLSSLLYFSDHGETPRGVKRGQTFSPGQVEIPMLFWFSDKFRQAQPGLIDILTGNRRKRFMSDHLFDTTLDLVGVDTNTYSPHRSLFRRQFVERNRTTLSGKLDYDGYPDPIIMARNNVTRLGIRFPRLTQKIYVWSGPSRTSLGQAIGLFGGVALDLVFNDEARIFDVAGSAPDARMTLRQVLEFLRSQGSDAKLLFRLGNVNERNAAQASATLITLEEEYRFRERVVLVVPDASEDLRALAETGLKTAFMITKRPDASSNELQPSDSVVVESPLDPSDSAFVESMSTLGDADATETIAIVVPALSKFEHHF
jgi:heptose-I-phosphate ethanolaminephosphotransferase